MIIDSFNLNQFRIFESVYRTKSMTVAARELYLTQSGVSQHIKALEDALDTKLFDRVKQKLVPTTEASLLYKESTESLNRIEHVIMKLKKSKNELVGRIRLGIPTEFGRNIIFPIVAEFGKQHPGIQFDFHVGFVSEMNDLILKGNLDFAFVDDFLPDKRIETARVYDELLELYVHKDLLKNKGDIKNSKSLYEQFPYVAYHEGEPVLRSWFEHHISSRNLKLHIKATVMDVQSVARLVLAGLGAGILPWHHVSQLGQVSKNLYCFKGRGVVLKNTISIAYLRDRTHSPAVLAIMEFIKKNISKGRAKIKG